MGISLLLPILNLIVCVVITIGAQNKKIRFLEGNQPINGEYLGILKILIKLQKNINI